MKNLITGMACLIILCVFLVQITGYQAAHSKLLYAETVVNTAVESARQAGCFTEKIKDHVRNSISAKLGCEPSEVTIDATPVPVLRGGIITYTITFPLKNVIGASKLLGISEEDNRVVRTITGSAASEYLE